MKTSRRRLLSAVLKMVLGFTSLLISKQTLAQVTLPKGAKVVAGNASVSQTGNGINVRSSANRTIIDWDSFSLSRDGMAEFDLPHANAAILNRVTSVDNPSIIAGKLTSNGNLFLVNPSGIMITESGLVNANGFTASTFDITNENFLAGHELEFTNTGSHVAIENSGAINSGPGGVHLLGDQILNAGIITSNGGNITLSGGGTVTLRNGVTYVQSSLKVLESGISQTAGLIQNAGTIRATGALTSGGEVYLVNPRGKILHDGTIVATKTSRALDAQGSSRLPAIGQNSIGGRVELEGDDIELTAGSSIDATGQRGGGTVLVGGQWQGGTDQEAGSQAMSQATSVSMDVGSTIDASAIESGDGGTIVLWSDVLNRDSITKAFGNLLARAGTLFGDGGKIETSGAQVETNGIRVDAGAPNGTGGLWLIDPFDYTIDAYKANNIVGTLNTGTSVTVTTTNSVTSHGGSTNNSDPGDITVASSILAGAMSGDATLTLKAHENIVLSPNVDIDATQNGNPNELHVVLWSDQDASGSGFIKLNSGSDIKTNGGDVQLGGGSDIATGYAVYNAPADSQEAISAPTHNAGIHLDGSNIDAGTGTVTMRGYAVGEADDFSHGIAVLNSSLIVSGNLNATGIADLASDPISANEDSYSNGVIFESSGISSTGDITLNGTGTHGDGGPATHRNFSVGVLLDDSDIVTTGGAIDITGDSNVLVGTDNNGILIKAGSTLAALGNVSLLGSAPVSQYAENSAGVHITETPTELYSTGGGTILVEGTGGDATTGNFSNPAIKLTDNASVGMNQARFASTFSPVILKGDTDVDANTRGIVTNAFEFGTNGFDKNIELISDSFDFVDTSLRTTGALKIEPFSARFSRAFDNLSDIGISSTLSGLIIGKPGNDQGVKLNAPLTINGNLDLYISDPEGSSSVKISADRVSVTATNHFIVSNITWLVDELEVDSAGPAWFFNFDNEIGTVAMVTGGDTVNYVINKNELTIGTVGSTSGISTQGDLSVQSASGDLTVAADVIVTGGGLILDAGSQHSAGDVTGGDIILNGSPTISVPSDERGVIRTGSVAGAIGVTELVGAGSGRFRYNGTFSALGDGLYAIYREQPTLTIANQNQIYGTPVATTAVNGDTLDQIFGVSTSVSYSGGLSTSGFPVIGTHTVTIGSGTEQLGYEFNGFSPITLTVSPKPLFYGVSNKIYDGNATASLTHGLDGLVTGDLVSASAAAGTFVDKNVGNQKVVNLTGTSITGADASNYTLTAAADITPKAITLSGLTANNKIYDGTTTATFDTGAAMFTGLIAGDAVNVLSAIGDFADKDVGTNKNVTISDVQLGGTDGANYSFDSNPQFQADITAKGLIVGNVTASDKVYDASTTASLDVGSATLTGIVPGDVVSLSTALGTFVDKNVGTNKSVSLDGIAFSGADAANYVFASQDPIVADIATAGITVSGIIAENKVYDGTTTALFQTGSATLSGVIGGDTVSVASVAGAFMDKNVGSNKNVSIADVFFGGPDAGNYSFHSHAAVQADISSRTLTVSGITANNKVYDGLTSATIDQSGAFLTGLIGGDSVNLDAASVTGTFADKNVATAKMVNLSGATYSGADVANYSITSQLNATADITAKSLVVSGISASNKVYDGTTAVSFDESTATLAGVVGGDTVTVASATGAFDSKNVGANKSVTISDVVFAGTDGGNYSFGSHGSMQANITPRTLSVAGVTASNKVYDGNTVATIDQSGTTFSGLISGDVVTLDTSSVSGAFDDKHVGTGKTVTLSGATYGGADLANYTIIDQVSATADISPKAATVFGITAENRVYDGTTVATIDQSGALFSGLVSGDNVLLNTSSVVGAFADKNVGNGKIVTLSGASYSGADIGNYTIADQPTANAHITPKAVTVSGITANNKVYDGTTSASIDQSGVTFSGLVSGDVLTLNASSVSGTFADKNAGTAKTVNLSGAAYGGTDVTNYTITDQATTTANINAAALNVSGIIASDKVYDGTTVATIDQSGATLNGLISGDIVTLSPASVSGVFADKNVGTGKTVSLGSATYGGTDLANYTISDQVSATADISPKAASVFGITAGSKVYDGTTIATIDQNGASFAGLVSGDNVILNSSSVTGSFDDKNVGNGKTVTLHGASYSGADIGNYTITDQATANAHITPKSIIVSGMTVNNKVYDGTTSASVDQSGASFLGLVSGDNLTLNASSVSGAFTDKNVGISKTVNLSGAAYSGTDVSNYTITDQASATANITAKGLTVSGIVANDRIYDGTTVASIDQSGATFHGLVSGDNVTLSPASVSGAFADKNVGTAKTVALSGASYGGVDLSNYSITDQASAAASITAKDVTVSGIAVSDKDYDGTTSASIDQSDVIFSGLVAGDTITLDANSVSGVYGNANVGVGKTVNLSGATYNGSDVLNYSITDQATATANITAKEVTVSGIVVSDKVYDGTTSSTVDQSGVTFMGLIGGDDLTLNASSVSGAFTDKNVGISKTVNLSGAAYSGTDLSNYTITDQLTATANITAKGLTVSGIVANDKVYDGTTVATIDQSGATFDGLISGDVVTLSSASVSGAFADKNVGTAKTVTLGGATYGGTDLANYAITDQVSATADISPKAASVFGITAESKVYDGTTIATIDQGGASFAGLVSGDNVILNSSSVTGSFADGKVGNGKTVNLHGASYSGVDVGNYVITDQVTANAHITARAVTVSGITADSKVYDGTTSASIDQSGVTFLGLVSGDSLTLDASSVSGTFSDKHVGTSKTVNLSGAIYGGADISNYAISDQATATASISAKDLTVSGVAANDKVYDGTTVASIDLSGATFSGLISGDVVTLSASSITGAFDDKNVGSEKTITLSGATYGGADLANYSIIDQETATANITAKGLTVAGIAANDKVYDGTTIAMIDQSGVTFSGLVSGDTIMLDANSVSGTFDNADVGARTVFLSGATYSGGDVVNYSITDQATASANITPQNVTVTGVAVSGITALDKVYDGTTLAAIDPSEVVFNGLIDGDSISLDPGSVTGVFDSPNVGARTVFLSGATYSGPDLLNYTITDQTTASANITPKALTVSGLSANDKVYDGLATAEIDTSSALLTGVLVGDAVTLASVSGAFSDRNAGAEKNVIVVDDSLVGTNATNYTLGNHNAMLADIAPRDTVVSGIAVNDKIYDGATTASLETSNTIFSGLISGDTLSVSSVTGTFVDSNAGTEKRVILSEPMYGGADAGNYNFTDQTEAIGNILPKPITVSGITAQDKVYDGTNAANIDISRAVFQGVVDTDEVTLLNASGRFSDRNVGNQKRVDITSSFSGADHHNYQITFERVEADIKPRAMTPANRKNGNASSSRNHPRPGQPRRKRKSRVGRTRKGIPILN